MCVFSLFFLLRVRFVFLCSLIFYFPKRKLRFPGNQINWVCELLTDYAIFPRELAQQAAKETKFGTRVA